MLCYAEGDGMGVYINPGNEGFRQIVADEYVDKTGLIALVNQTIDKPRPLVCVTRPRRFGKSFSADARCILLPWMRVGPSLCGA
jgi:hypothetical protein